MYYVHFRLNQPPFRITPNTEFFLGGGNRGPMLEALIYAVAQGEGMVKVTGEAGSGKTMLCNMLQARLPANVETVYLAHPNVPPEEVLHAIALKLQLGVAPGAFPTPSHPCPVTLSAETSCRGSPRGGLRREYAKHAARNPRGDPPAVQSGNPQ